ncbi:hypothetical protein SteCoe_28069 [Stentor coeruleus]|uniref:Aminotransferase class V domain-containing protein n=1 Tax=Stentor coeruleus TaxID=5963 RepID=A0A1R2B945_9CILI|nr:hypothetical protein SteCoe_28069 [Stentor coeruleus]
MIFRSFSALKKLFWIGPVQTSAYVKESVSIDYGSRDPNFGSQVEGLKTKILSSAHLNRGKYACIIMQGPPKYITESLISTINPGQDKMLMLNNGNIAQSMCQLAMELHKPLYFNPLAVKKPLMPITKIKGLMRDTTHLVLVHEETSGILNPVSELCASAKAKNPNITTIVNGCQAFDWTDLDFTNISFYIGSFHTVIQAFNGISFCIANLNSLNQTKNKYQSLALDLYDQYDYQVNNPGQSRFTPPTHLIAAAYAGIQEWEKEGINNRFLRYSNNKSILIEGLTKLGFEFAIDPKYLGYSSITVKSPKSPNWNRMNFCKLLEKEGFILCAESMVESRSLQIGFSGDLDFNDIKNLLEAIEKTLKTMDVNLSKD